MCRMRAALTVLAAVLAASVPVAQMNTGELGGVVRDESGGVLPGATVTALHVATGLSVERVTDTQGRFFMASLPVGLWELVVAMPGFRRVVQSGLVVELGQKVDLEYALQLGQITEEVTVTAPVPLLQLTTGEISHVIQNQQLEQIPLNGRQFLQWPSLAPRS